jgi:hypothetical protein
LSSLEILGASFTMYDEAFPLFSMSKIDAGGLGFTTAGNPLVLFLHLISLLETEHNFIFVSYHSFNK